MSTVLELRGITKRFPGVLANDHIDFHLDKGEVLAFLGENGAGKTTLMNILDGLYSPDEGEILLNGEKVQIEEPNDAIARGIGMVHQHFMLVPVMSVVENVVLGTETQALFGLNLSAPMRRVQAFLRWLNPLPRLQRRFAGPYRIARSALTWCGLYILFFGLEFMLFLLGQPFWAVLVALLAISAGVYSLVASRRSTVFWAEPKRGRLWLILLSLATALALAGLISLAGGLPAAGTGLETLLRLLLYVALGHIGLWLLLGLYLVLLEVLLWFSELVPLGLKADAKKVAEISHKYGLDVDPEAIVGDLPVGIQQRVEIVKALYREADILILDEPTAVLTPQEADELFDVMRSLTEQGKSIMFITHKLREVLAIADRIIVLRDGRVAGEALPEEATRASLAALMVGREVILTVNKEEAEAGETVLTVEDLHALDERRHPMVRGVSLEVRAGEILGVAGVQGNGQTELVKVLTGLQSPTSGHVWIGCVETTHSSPRQITELGVAHVPEDRQRDGLVLTYPVHDNLMLCTYYQPPIARGVLINDDVVFRQAEELVATFDIRTPSIALPTRNLSGGNQQKVIVARELSRPIQLLIASQPTRGLDVGSIEFIHRRIVEKRDAGAAVLLVSAELDEIMGLSDRIAVVFEGKIVYTVDARDTTREELGLWMAGGAHQHIEGGDTHD